MFEKIPLNKLYVADYVDETLEYVYGGVYKSSYIIHHFNIKFHILFYFTYLNFHINKVMYFHL